MFVENNIIEIINYLLSRVKSKKNVQLAELTGKNAFKASW